MKYLNTKRYVFAGGLFCLTMLIACYPDSACQSDPDLLDHIHIPVVNSVLIRADEFKYEGSYEKALQEFQALLKTEKDLNEDESTYLYNQITLCHFLLNEFEQGNAYLNELNKYYQLGKIRTGGNLADYYFNLGLNKERDDEAGAAMTAYQKASEIYQRIYPKGHLRQALTLAHLGVLHYDYSSTPDSAFICTTKAEQIFSKNIELKPFSAKSHYGMSQLALSIRDYILGITHCNLGIKIQEQSKNPDKILLLKLKGQLGHMLRKREQFDQSKKIIGEAIQIAMELPQKSQALLQLYQELLLTASVAQDSLLFMQTVDELTSSFSQLQLEELPLDRFFGRFYHEMGQPRKSIDYYENLLLRYELLEHPNRKVLGEIYYYLTENYNRIGQQDKAIHYIRTYTKFINKIEEEEYPDWTTFTRKSFVDSLLSPFQYVLHGQLSKVYTFQARNQPTQSRALLRAYQLQLLFDKIFFDRILAREEDAYLTHLKEVGSQVYPYATEVAYALFQDTGDSKYIEWAHLCMERMKSFVYYMDQATQLLTQHAIVPDSLLVKEKMLRFKINDFKHRGIDGLDQEFAIVRRNWDQLLRQLEEQYPRYYHGRINQTISPLAQIQEHLASNETILQLQLHEDKIHFLVINSDSVNLLQSDLDYETLKVRINSFRMQLEKIDLSASQIKAFLGDAHWLYQKLFKIPSQYIPDGNQVIIIPDGLLNQIPFEALVADATSENQPLSYQAMNFLIRHYQISYAQSLKSFQQLRALIMENNGQYSKDILAYSSMGNNKKHSALRKALQNYRSAQKTYRFGPDCNLKSFAGDVNHRYDIAHFEVHASSNEKDKLNNYLDFSPFSSSDTANYVYGYQIAAHDLHWNLVLLTACQSAYGPALKGEGTYSLSRAFKQAGVREVIASLWEIDAYATAQISSSFYLYLDEGSSPNKALWEAKVHFLTHERAALAHPSFWAGLVLII